MGSLFTTHRQVAAFLAVLVATACATQKTNLGSASVVKQLTVEPKNYVYLQQAGFKLVRKDGKTVYCTRSATTGTHLQHTITCLSLEEWQQVQDANRRTTDAFHTPLILPPKTGQ